LPVNVYEKFGLSVGSFEDRATVRSWREASLELSPLSSSRVSTSDYIKTSCVARNSSTTSSAKSPIPLHRVLDQFSRSAPQSSVPSRPAACHTSPGATPCHYKSLVSCKDRSLNASASPYRCKRCSDSGWKVASLTMFLPQSPTPTSSST